jgi:hypothetical protein
VTNFWHFWSVYLVFRPFQAILLPEKSVSLRKQLAPAGSCPLGGPPWFQRMSEDKSIAQELAETLGVSVHDALSALDECCGDPDAAANKLTFYNHLEPLPCASPSLSGSVPPPVEANLPGYNAKRSGVAVHSTCSKNDVVHTVKPLLR